MAEEADDRRVRDQLKVLTGLKLPGFNWKANNMTLEFDIFYQTLASSCWRAWRYQRISGTFTSYSNLAERGWSDGLQASKPQSTKKTPLKSSKHSRKATSWKRHTGRTEAFTSAVRSKDGGKRQPLSPPGLKTWSILCKWPAEQKELRRIDLYYHLSEVFDVRRFVQIETSREGGNLTWEKLVEEAKRQECVGKEYAKFRRENGGGGTPSYGDPALAADAVSRGYNNLSRDHGHRLVAKEARARSSVIDAEDATAALARRELVQHGARSVAFAEGRTTTRQSARRLLRCKQEEAPNPSSRSKGKANLLVRMEKQRPNTLTPLCLRRSHQQRG